MMWLVFAISAAVIWGLNYSLDEKILQNKVSPYILLLIQATVAVIVYTIIIGSANLKHDVLLLIKNKTNLWLLAGSATCFVAANILICLSIQGKNATIAGLIELAYPIFTIFFTYIIFKQLHLNWGVITGGILIFLGVLLISIVN